jgi:hypothetical protein
VVDCAIDMVERGQETGVLGLWRPAVLLPLVAVRALFIAEKSVAKHAAGIFSRLGLALSDDDNRRVLAVLAYLNG